MSSDSHPFKKKHSPALINTLVSPLGARITERRGDGPGLAQIYWSVLKAEIGAPRDNKWVSSTVSGHPLRSVFQLIIYKMLQFKGSNIFISHWVVLTTKCQSAGLRSTGCRIRAPTEGLQGNQFLRLQPPLRKGFWQDTSHSSTHFPGHQHYQVNRACCQFAVSKGGT